MYGPGYPYLSSATQTGRDHFAELAASLTSQYKTHKNSHVLDIGSNDGVLLKEFQKLGMKVLGIDPASEVANRANKEGIDTLNQFFSEKSVSEIRHHAHEYHVITATNVFVHIPDIVDAIRAIELLLAPGGVFVIEAPSLANLIAATAYDTICHEHMGYISVTPLKRFFESLDLELIDVTSHSIHGGTIRLIISQPRQHPVSDRVQKAIEEEQKLNLFSEEHLRKFSDRVVENREKLITLINDLKQQGHSIAAVSAPAKGNTLLNYCGIDHRQIDFVTEKSDLKIGRYTPGTHIPVVDDSELIIKQPDYALILAWNFKDEIMNNLDAYRKRGGQFIIPVPEPMIIQNWTQIHHEKD